MAKSNAERLRDYRARCKAEGRSDTTRRNKRAQEKARLKRRRSARVFVGCDGEGAGTDELGRQDYLLFRMGERELYTGSRLLTDELLDFICSHPAADILVGFAFGYDVTMILRDLAEDQKRRLFEPKVFGEGRSPFVWHHDFDIDYLPKQYLRVRRVKRIRDPLTGKIKRVGVKGSTRIIYETFGFFQKSFLKVLEEFKIGTPAELAQIAKSKAARGDDAWSITAEERDYCALECRLLAELMESLRTSCEAAGIVPRTWNGAGKLAKALLAEHKAPTARQVAGWVPPEVMDLANLAYYGGRFEITRTGLIAETVHEYDIGSAYPSGMTRLPCLEHGTWRRAKPAELRRTDRLFVAPVTFATPLAGLDGKGAGQLGGLPIRTSQGHLHWPLNGGGVYWSCEIRSAERMGVNVRYREGWLFEPHCDCHVFDWIEPLFDYRRSIGKSGPGYPIKLGCNSLYGAQAQRVGSGKYANMVYAGLTTADTRARLNDAISQAPNSIVMVATDGIYSLQKLQLDVGDRLGQWEHSELQGLFIVQPGLYWCPEKRKRKSRGLSGRFFEEPGRTEGFEAAWSAWSAAAGQAELPAVEVPVPGFVGIKLAMARGKPELAGCWIEDSREISFDYRNKRAAHVAAGGHIVTTIKRGAPGVYSIPHRDFLAAGGAEPWEAARLMLDEQPDYVDLGIPFKD